MSRYKPKSTTPEVFFARNKLDGLLQNLLDNTGESQELEEPLPDDELPGSSMLVQTSPSKHRGSSASKSRKRRRVKEEPESVDIGYHHTYVMKLFDRSVDLAQFEQNTPLYPICRAWMQNQPHNRNLANRPRTPSPQPPEEDTESGEGGNIYRMPSPVSVKQEIMFETDYYETRVPSPVPQPDEVFDINQDPAMAPPPEQLLLNHMARWKTIRHKWKQASQQYEAQFAPGMNLLRDMFERQCKDQ